MEEWLRSLAVGLAVLTGLVTPADGLKVESSALKTPQNVLVVADLSGGLPEPAREYLLAGNSLTLQWLARWGERSTGTTRTLTYHAWDRVFVVTDDGGSVILETADQARALRSWQNLPPTLLGSREVLGRALGQPLRVSVGLKGAQESLWGYQRAATSLTYSSWGEMPQ